MKTKTPFLCATALAVTLSAALSSSHREAPSILSRPQVDATDFYMFSSYENDREDYVTIIANYLPLQDAYGGPNYFPLDEQATYSIHISNDGGADADISIDFNFSNTYAAPQLNIGGEMVAIPLLATGPITAGDAASLHFSQSYTVSFTRDGVTTPLTIAGTGSSIFTKPQDNVGNKTFPDYEAYADQFIYEIDVPGSDLPGRLFVGQRKDPFVVNLGEVFDLVNLNPVGAPNSRQDDLADANVTSLILELPKDALTNLPFADPLPEEFEPVIGGWTTASLPNGADGRTQVSRLGQPLVNEVVIGVPDKDLFNSSPPASDGANFLTYVTHPTLPALLEILFGVSAPTTPRMDLVTVFLTGVPNLNQPSNIAASEMLRLNTRTATLSPEMQNTLGVIAGDTAGFPNGRRPGDDVVDIALRAVMGVLLDESSAPSGQLPYTDGAAISAMDFLNTFPYLNPPIAGSPNDPSFEVTVSSSETLSNFTAIGNASYDDSSKTLNIPRRSEADKEFYRLGGEASGMQLEVRSVSEESVTLDLTISE